MDAAEPAGENYEATRQWGQLVAFAREIDADEYERDGDNYDAGGELNETIALSRLVRDNAFCSEYAARIIERNGRPRQIAPILSFERRLAYRIQTGRPWLSEAEVAELRTLREAYRAVELPEKVKRALWRTERTVHSPYLSESVTNSVTGLEALLKTERQGYEPVHDSRACSGRRARACPRRCRLGRRLRSAF
jgi:hypothetical protein